MAHGTQVKPVDFEHPLADYLERLRNNALYRAVFTEGANGLTGARVIGRSAGGAAVAIECEVAGGRVIFLPALPPGIDASGRQTTASSIASGVRNLLLRSAEGTPPEWVDAFDVPGIDEAKKRLDLAETQLESVETEADEARRAYLALAVHRRLLWQEGKYGFDLPVRDALAELGFRAAAAMDEPAVFYYGGEQVLVETESSVGPVGMEPHYRLRERLEAKIAGEGTRPKGLIVINGFREALPEERPQPFQDALRVAAESMRYAVVDSLQLYGALCDKLEGKDVKPFLQRLIETEGVVLPTGAEE
jgi:hypothetical protein